MAEVLIRRAVKEKLLVLCTREYQTSIRDSVHRVLKAMIFRLGLSSYFDITSKSIVSESGSEFIFKGLHNNVEEIKSTEGVDITWVVEAQNTTEESWVNLLPTIYRQQSSELWIGFNVTDENSPTHKRFVTKPPEGAIVHKVNYTENPYFPPLMRKLMEEDRANNPDTYNHIWLGMPRRISNAIVLGGKYKIEWFPEDLWKKADRLYFGADFGFASDPSTLVRLFVIEKKIYVEYEAGGVGIELDEMEELYDSIPGSREWPIKADNSRPETISHIKAKRFNISSADKWPGSIEDGIAHLRGHTIIIHPRCVQTAMEAGTYSYKVDQHVIDPATNAPQVLPIIIDSYNHYIDAIRYALDGYIQRRNSLKINSETVQQFAQKRSR